MAKRDRRRQVTRLDKAAAGIGRALGQALKRIDKWRSQRAAIAIDIRKVLTAGQQALTDPLRGDEPVRRVRSVTTNPDNLS